MTKSDWKSIAELVGIAAIVASLIFLSVQLIQDRQAALSGVSQNAASNYTELQVAIAYHAEVLAKSNRNEDLTEAEKIVINSLVSAMHRQAASDALERRRLGATGEVVSWIFASWLHDNPGALDVWNEQRDRLLVTTGNVSPDGGVINRYTDEIRTLLDLMDESRH